MHRLSILNQHGDQVLTWDNDLAKAVEDVVTTAEAEAAFAKMKAAGYLAYKQDASGQNPEVIQRFDKEAPEIVMTPAMQGG